MGLLRRVRSLLVAAVRTERTLPATERLNLPPIATKIAFVMARSSTHRGVPTTSWHRLRPCSGCLRSHLPRPISPWRLFLSSRPTSFRLFQPGGTCAL